ncbi:MAG: hypothetical protein C0415_05965 [Thermodesulfovibrio sp.]|nr:hypothetical protein [Thermodesulfovibrio sp.]
MAHKLRCSMSEKRPALSAGSNLAVYVDKPLDHPAEAVAAGARRYGTRWCHLWADKGMEAELHRIAGVIGVKREWFQSKSQFPHYDIVPSKYTAAIKAGAMPRSLKDWIKARRGKKI